MEGLHVKECKYQGHIDFIFTFLFFFWLFIFFLFSVTVQKFYIFWTDQLTQPLRRLPETLYRTVSPSEVVP